MIFLRCVLARFLLTLLLLCGLQGLPIAQHLARRVGLYLAKDVRMTIDEFVAKTVEHIVDREAFLFLRHLSVEEHLQQQVAELACKLVPVARVDGLDDFVGFLQGKGLDGVEGLLAVPGASARPAEPRHDRYGALKSFASGGHQDDFNRALSLFANRRSPEIRVTKQWSSRGDLQVDEGPALRVLVRIARPVRQESLGKQFGIVRDQAVHTPTSESQQLCALIYGPGEQLQVARVNLVNQQLGD